MKISKLLLSVVFSIIFFVLVLSLPKDAEAAIAFRAASTTNNTSGCGTQSVTVNVPTGTVNGDVMVVDVMYGGTTQMSTPAGWNLINNISNTNSASQMTTTFWRLASSEPASYTWTMPALVCWITGAVSYSGVNQSTPIDANTINMDNTGTSHIASAVTTTVANDIIVTFFNGYNATTPTWTPPAGQTERIDANNASVRSIEVNDSTQAAAGSSGAFTATSSLSLYSNNVTIALKPQPTAPEMSNKVGTTGTIDVGPLSPTTMWSDNYDAYSKPWTNPSNAISADGQYTTAVLDGSLNGRYTSFLWGYGFGFSIPTSATIVGITADVKSSISSGADNWYTFLSTCANVTQGSGGGCLGGGVGKYIGVNTTMQYGSAGSASDMWGVAWTPANINSANFGMRVQEKNIVSSGSYTYSIDHYRITVTIQSVSNITATSATLAGYVNSDGGSAITGRGVCYSTSANPTSPCTPTTGTIGGFTIDISGLNPNTVYHFRSYATNAYGTTYSTDDTFTTLAGAPTITTPTSASITVSSATLGGNVTSAGGSSLTAKGVCYAPTGTDADPRIGDPGVTCSPQGTTTTGVFTVGVSNLLANTGYSYNAYATNSYGTVYVLSTFSTLNPAPTTVGTATSGTPQSYYVTLNGSANPNGYQTYGHFRVFNANPGSCSSDTGGTRYPEGTVNFPDLDLGAGTSVVSAPTFSYTIPFNASNWLTPNTTYYYCAYAVNTVNSTNYTTGGSGVVSFTTPDGPANPCDPPSSGNLSIPSGAVCNFVGTVGGVDAGTGTRNTAQITIPATTRLSISAGQKIAFGSLSLGRGAVLSIARGGSLSGGGVYVHDNDRDNYLDDATQYVGSTASAATEFIRRNAISSIFNYAWKIASSGATYDCNKNTAYAYRVLPNLVRDADNDGYKTSTAAGPQCVGAAGTFIVNGTPKVYYNDGSGPN